MKKNHSVTPPPRRTRLTAEQKQKIRAHRSFLLDKWGLGLEATPLDWDQLFATHWELHLLERQYPWLKKAAA